MTRNGLCGWVAMVLASLSTMSAPALPDRAAAQATVAAAALSTPATSPEDLVLIPAGTFQMGDLLNEGGEDESPAHAVSLDAFLIGKFEVRKGEWDEIRRWAITRGYEFDYLGSGKGPNHPVHSINWFDALKWCNARSEREGRPPCYSVDGAAYKTGQTVPACDWTAKGYRLPTEAEWECAARGGLAGRRFPWDDATIQHTRANYYSLLDCDYDTSRTQGYHPLCNNNIMPFTAPVGSFAPNGFGLYDMAGNVWEWCWDEYDPAYYGVSSPAHPKGPSAGAVRRAERGGSWRNRAFSCRVSDRDSDVASAALNRVGFRIVLPQGP